MRRRYYNYKSLYSERLGCTYLLFRKIRGVCLYIIYYLSRGLLSLYNRICVSDLRHHRRRRWPLVLFDLLLPIGEKSSINTVAGRRVCCGGWRTSIIRNKNEKVRHRTALSLLYRHVFLPRSPAQTTPDGTYIGTRCTIRRDWRSRSRPIWRRVQQRCSFFFFFSVSSPDPPAII